MKSAFYLLHIPARTDLLYVSQEIQVAMTLGRSAFPLMWNICALLHGNETEGRYDVTMGLLLDDLQGVG
jgi:hypothetical protein